MFLRTIIFIFLAFYAPKISFAQTQQLPQDTLEIGVFRRLVEIPIKSGTLFVSAAGEVSLAGKEWKKTPFYTFLESGNSQTCVWVQVKRLYGATGFDPDEESFFDNFRDTFSLVSLYKFLEQKNKEHGVKISDRADNEITISAQTISFQKLKNGIRLNWSNPAGSFLRVTLTPDGKLVDEAKNNVPLGFSSIPLAWLIGQSSFNRW